ncbi:hypothetical protein CLG85_012470 [Yangia mangrovi]|uniref:Uncharacterized protein n=1 Tax=Alloyangia mangrovi TaxID=1779329 RepID=A0ABT2KL30_9RHOB|nr:hypothetical protein [Alloyangia mangrovi]MCT4371084.1 hypothetical protein [Alloyangia mangrovi]
MSKTLRRSCASCGVSRSKSNVAKPRAINASATARLRGLSRLDPLPWAKMTSPRGSAGTERSPASASGGTETLRREGTAESPAETSSAQASRSSPWVSSSLSWWKSS